MQTRKHAITALTLSLLIAFALIPTEGSARVRVQSNIDVNSETDPGTNTGEARTEIRVRHQVDGEEVGSIDFSGSAEDGNLDVSFEEEINDGVMEIDIRRENRQQDDFNEWTDPVIPVVQPLANGTYSARTGDSSIGQKIPSKKKAIVAGVKEGVSEVQILEEVSLDEIRPTPEESGERGGFWKFILGTGDRIVSFYLSFFK